MSDAPTGVVTLENLAFGGVRAVSQVSAIIATGNRPESLAKTLNSLVTRGLLPAELVVIDSSSDSATRIWVCDFAERVSRIASVRWAAASIAGAASQRNQGFALATQPFIWFFDDDVLFEIDCVRRLWRAMEGDERLGGVNAMIVNQRYQSPSLTSRAIFAFIHGRREKNFAGKVIGPGINFLPEDRQDLPEVVPVEWLNTTCTIYRREALPKPPFSAHFTGYSLMEDLALSLNVANRGWKLANARTARIFHDSQPGEHKSDPFGLSRMELINRHYVMSAVLNRHRFVDYLRLILFEAYQVAASFRGGIMTALTNLRGKVSAVAEIVRRID